MASRGSCGSGVSVPSPDSPTPPRQNEHPTPVQLMAQMMRTYQQQFTERQEAHQAVVDALLAQLAQQKAHQVERDELAAQIDQLQQTLPVISSPVPPSQTTSSRKPSRSLSRRSLRRDGYDKSRYCHYCKHTGHVRTDCWHRLGYCLRCGSPNHKMIACPRPPPKARSSAPLISKEPGSSSSSRRGPPLPSQQECFRTSCAMSDGA